MTPGPQDRGPLETNLRWAFGWTFSSATAFSGYVAIQALLQGSSWFPRYHLSLWAIVGGYYAAAFLSGVALAILRPLGETRLGAYLLGAVVGFFVYASIGLLVLGLSWLTLGIATVPALATGGLGVVFYDDQFAAPLGSLSPSKGRLFVYGAALLIALVLLWLDIRFHIINK